MTIILIIIMIMIRIVIRMIGKHENAPPQQCVTHELLLFQ